MLVYPFKLVRVIGDSGTHVQVAAHKARALLYETSVTCFVFNIYTINKHNINIVFIWISRVSSYWYNHERVVHNPVS